MLASSSDAFLNNRADLTADPFLNLPAAGGRLLLNPSSFQPPPPTRIGNTGRNAFRGPGMYNIDLSLSRALPLRLLGDAGTLRLRMDASNVLNHANLNNPENLLGSPDFGVARFGRAGREGVFPALIPFTESPRTFQILLRIEF